MGRAQHRDRRCPPRSPVRSSAASAERSTGIRFVEALADGPAALLVEGEAGIGKTMLWRAVAAAAVERGHLVMSATAVDDETDLPFVAFRDLFDGVAAPTEALPPVQRDAWGTALLRSTQPVAAADHQAVSAAVLGVVRALAARRRLVVAVDDVIWMDRPPIGCWLCVRRLTVRTVGILAAPRAAPGTYSDVPLALDRPSLAHRLQVVELGPLDTGSLHGLLVAQGGAPLPRRTTRQIHQMSGAARSTPPRSRRSCAAVERPPSRRGPAAAAPADGEHRGTARRPDPGRPPGAHHGRRGVSSHPHAGQRCARHGVRRRPGRCGGRQDVEVDGIYVRFAHPLLRFAVAAAAPDAPGARCTAVSRRSRGPRRAAGASGRQCQRLDESIALAVEQAAERAFRRVHPTLPQPWPAGRLL